MQRQQRELVRMMPSRFLRDEYGSSSKHLISYLTLTWLIMLGSQMPVYFQCVNEIQKGYDGWRYTITGNIMGIMLSALVPGVLQCNTALLPHRC